MQKLEIGFDGESNVFDVVHMGEVESVFIRKSEQKEGFYLASALDGYCIFGEFLNTYVTGSVEKIIDLLNRSFNANLVLQ